MASGSERAGISIAHFEPLQRLEYRRGDHPGLHKPGVRGPLTMRFDALGRSFDLELAPNARLSAAGSAASPYAGQIAGRPGSWARITLIDGQPRGLIHDGSEMYVVESPAGAAPVIYRLSDTYIDPGALTCGGAGLHGNGAQVFQSVVREMRKSGGPGAVSQMDFSVIADSAFEDDFGANSEAELRARMNNVDGIFSAQLGVQLNVSFVEVFDTDSDPFSDTLESNTLLNELAGFRVAEDEHRSRGLTHLFTGRNFATTTVGVAYSSELCDVRFGAGLTQATHGELVDSLIAAHEIGHNFGAPHDGVPGTVCESAPTTFLMAPSVNSSDEFSDCSIQEMSDDIAAASCITPMPNVDLDITPTAQPDPVLLGNAARVSFDVVNLGATGANDVTAEVELPAGFDFVSAAATGGDCSAGAGTVSCDIGVVAGSGSSTLIVTTRPQTTGIGSFRATVDSQADFNHGNNVSVVEVSVIPAVDLSIESPGAIAVTVDQSVSVRVDLANLSPLAATGVTLSVDLGNGLEVQAATWSLGSCNMSARQVDCSTDAFGGSSTATLDLTVSATSTGGKSYTVTLESAETDANTADNTLAGTINVNAVGGGSGGGNGAGAAEEDGGAGTAGPFLLLLLGSLLAGSGRRRTAWARNARSSVVPA